MSDDTKQVIRSFIKTSKSIPSSFGNIAVTGPPLGEGGNGIVYPVDFEGQAVVKILTEQISDTPSAKLVRFQREYCRLVRIPSHPNLIRLFHYEDIAVGEIQVPMIFMERCTETLKNRIQNKGPLDATEFRKLCVSMCKAIQHIHSNGIIHRDVKPENILIRDDGSYVLADFGIASFDPEVFPGNQLTKKGDRMANAQFSAPEQFEKDAEVSPAADVYALGQVLYWCVTKTTFRGASPPTMTSVNKELFPFENLVNMMPKQQASARIQTAKGVLNQLEADDDVERKKAGEMHVIESLHRFEEALRKSTPGKREIVHLSTQNDINRLFSLLESICLPCKLWWTQGAEANSIQNIEQISPEIWVINSTESKVTDCWVTRDSGLDRCSVLIRSEGLPSFGIDGENSTKYQEVGLFDGKYISREEHDDGYTQIGDAVVSLEGRSVIRSRFRQPRFFFIATTYNSICLRNAYQVVGSLIKNYESGKQVDPMELLELKRLPKHPVSSMYD